MSGLKVTYTIVTDFSFYRFSQLLYSDDGPTYKREHTRKGEDIWYKGSSDQPEEQPDMANFPTNEELIKAWNDGLIQAQNELRTVTVQIMPSVNDGDNSDWFYEPHTATAAQITQSYTDDTPDDTVENDTGESFDESDETGLEDLFNAEIRGQLDENLTEGESTRSNILNVPGYGPVHKTTIVSNFNSTSGGNLSWDRLVRVRGHKVCSRTQSEDGNDIGLYDDIIYKTSSTVEWALGRVLRMRKRE